MLSLLGLGVAVLAGLASKHAEDSAALAATGWGSEATVALAEGVAQLSPISLANACGLGASSCFKCHNGKRAAAPEMNAAKAPWHAQHAKVNGSCTGCHKGNSRIMKQEVAHAKMLAKPRDNTGEACGGCHKGDLAAVQGAYHTTSGAK
jgi:nitrate/TMAO reductase-like tetraheme cytochrome c subunit